LNYSIRTEDAYIDWARRFVMSHDKRRPRNMGAPEVEAFLTHLAISGRCRLRSRKSALLFFYRQVLEIDEPWLTDVAAADIDSHPVSSGAATATKKYCSGP